MTIPKTKSELLTRVEELNDLLGAAMYDRLLLETTRTAQRAATAARVTILSCARHAGVASGSAAGGGGVAFGTMLGGHEAELKVIVAEQALASLPEVEEARKIVEPLEAEMQAVQDALNKIETEAEATRRAIAAEIEAAERKAMASKNIVELREKLSALNG